MFPLVHWGNSHGLCHFIFRLDAIQLRLQEQSPGVEFMRGSRVNLRLERSAFFDLLHKDAARFLAQCEKFFRHLGHLVCSFQLVERRLHSELDVFLDAREILLGLSQLSFVPPDRCTPPAAIKKGVAEVNPKRSEIAGCSSESDPREPQHRR
jgi:hypothetical protein